MSRPIYKNQCLIMSELISIPNPHHQSTKTVEITITHSLNKQCKFVKKYLNCNIMNTILY